MNLYKVGDLYLSLPNLSWSINIWQIIKITGKNGIKYVEYEIIWGSSFFYRDTPFSEFNKISDWAKALIPLKNKKKSLTIFFDFPRTLQVKR